MSDLMDEPKLKPIDIKIQSAARRAELERNSGPKVLNPERFERDDHLADGTVRVLPKPAKSSMAEDWPVVILMYGAAP